MFPYETYSGSNGSFRSELESSLTRGGPAGLAYAEANKYSLKQQLLDVHEVCDHALTLYSRFFLDFSACRDTIMSLPWLANGTLGPPHNGIVAPRLCIYA